MKRVVCALWVLAGTIGGLGCSDPDPASPDAAPIMLTDAAPPDARPPPDATPPVDAVYYEKGPAVEIDEMNLVGRGEAFQTIAPLLNSQLNMMINSGTLLWALEFRGLDDPSGQDDAEVEIGFYQAYDPDGDSSNNVDAENPDRHVADPTTENADGSPVVSFAGSIVGGFLSADGGDVINIPTGIMDLELHDPSLQGFLEPAPDDSSIYFMADGPDGKGGTIPARLEGTVPVSALAATPNLASMFGCPGSSMLELLVFGCETMFFTLPAAQPDGDLDEDGLESLCDTCDSEPCASRIETPSGGTPDSVISCCVDGDGTVTEGDTCAAGEGIADGYVVELDIHATRIILMTEKMPTK